MDMERSQFLVETSWLAEHLNDPHIRIVDMRGYVRTVERNGVQNAQYVGARDEYEQGHIPGAVYIDWSSDIIDLDDAVKAQVAPAARFAEVIGSLGIGDQHLVVAYDAHPSAQFATRLWWALNYYGHDQVVVLNGGFAKWLHEHRPLEESIPTYPPATFTPVVQPRLRTTATEVLSLLERRSRNGKDEVDRKSQGWLAQEKRTCEEKEHATIALAATSRAFSARRADCEKDSQSQIVCVFASTPARIAGGGVSARIGQAVSRSRARAIPCCT